MTHVPLSSGVTDDINITQVNIQMSLVDLFIHLISLRRPYYLLVPLLSLTTACLITVVVCVDLGVESVPLVLYAVLNRGRAKTHLSSDMAHIRVLSFGSGGRSIIVSVLAMMLVAFWRVGPVFVIVERESLLLLLRVERGGSVVLSCRKVGS